MIQKISAPVSVTLVYNHHQQRSLPTTIIWEGKKHTVVTLGLHHTYRQGRTLYHVFSVASQTLFFKLVLNTDNLHWWLEEIADSQVN